MESVAKFLIAHVDKVLAGWNALRVEEHWTGLPERERIDDLPRLITTLVEAALLRPGEIDSHRALVSAAAAATPCSRRATARPAWRPPGGTCRT